MKKVFTGALMSLFLFMGCTQGPLEDGKYAEIAQCLTDKNVTMYGAFWCPHCDEQKELFGADFRYVTYVECDPRGENADPGACRQANVRSYPTWVFPGQDSVTGAQNPEALANKANCPLPGEAADAEPVSDEGAVADEDPASEMAEGDEPVNSGDSEVDEDTPSSDEDEANESEA